MTVVNKHGSRVKANDHRWRSHPLNESLAALNIPDMNTMSFSLRHEKKRQETNRKQKAASSGTW